jgi:hypothetical protein
MESSEFATAENCARRKAAASTVMGKVNELLAVGK